MHCKVNTLRTHSINQTVDFQKLERITENYHCVCIIVDFNRFILCQALNSIWFGCKLTGLLYKLNISLTQTQLKNESSAKNQTQLTLSWQHCKGFS